MSLIDEMKIVRKQCLLGDTTLNDVAASLEAAITQLEQADKMREALEALKEDLNYYRSDGFDCMQDVTIWIDLIDSRVKESLDNEG